jgi:hypothetical protein
MRARRSEMEMNPGDVCRIRVHGRAYLGVIERVGNKVHIRWTNSHYPMVNFHRAQRVALLKERFAPYGKAGINWIVKDVK